MGVIYDLEDAILDALATVPGVATRERYAGQLDAAARSTIRVPALLLAVGEWAVDIDPGTDQVEARLAISLFVAARNAAGPEARAADITALCETLLPLIRLNRFGATGAGPAKLAQVVPRYLLESQGIGIREIRWTQTVRIGTSTWDGDGVTPEQIYLGFAPEIGAGHEDDYIPVQSLPVGVDP